MVSPSRVWVVSTSVSRRTAFDERDPSEGEREQTDEDVCQITATRPVGSTALVEFARFAESGRLPLEQPDDRHERLRTRRRGRRPRSW